MLYHAYSYTNATSSSQQQRRLKTLTTMPRFMILYYLALTSIAFTEAFGRPFYQRIPLLRSSTTLNSFSWLRRVKSLTVRGSHYNTTTILTPNDAAIAVGVKPTAEASKYTWQTAWRIHRFMLPILHYRLWDRCEMKDSKLALAVLWWKAM